MARGHPAAGDSKRTQGVVPVVLLPNRKANKRGVSGEVAENADTHSPTVIVYVAQIADIIREIRDGSAHRVTRVMLSVDLGHVLALTIAHEVGHILGLPHAATGIMKAEPELDELLQLRASRLSFSPSEIAKIQLAMAARASRVFPDTR